MPIRLGSNEYFRMREASTQHINTIGAGNRKGKLKGFDKFCAKISYFVRKYLLPGDSASWEKKVQTRVDDLKAKCRKQQVTYNVQVDNHVNEKIKGVQQEAFDSFMKKIPTLKAKLEELTTFDELSKHEPLIDAYNAITGLVKIDSCKALAELKKVLEGVKPGDGDEASDFYLKINELSELLKNSDENKFIDKNLRDLTAALVDWKDYDDKHNILEKLDDKATTDERNKAFSDFNLAQKNVIDAWDESSKGIEHLLSPEGLNTAKTIPLAQEWATKMKDQKANLIKSVDSIMILRVDSDGKAVGYSKKRYGFFQDRVDEAKKIAKIQQKELKKLDNLDLSFANYLSDSTSELWTPLQKGLKNAKVTTIIRNEENLKDTVKDLTRYTDVKDVKNLNKNKALYEKNQKVYKKYWKPLEGLDKKIVSEKASVAKLTERINKNYSKDNANKLAALYADSAEKSKEINIELFSYAVKHGFETLCFETEKQNLKPFGVTKDSNLADCGKVITKCDTAIKAFTDLASSIAYLKKELKVPFKLEAGSSGAKASTFEEAQKWIADWTRFYKDARADALNHSNILQEEILFQSIAAAQEQSSGAAEDKQFLDNLPYDLVQTDDDGNCFFHTIKAGLDLQVDPRFNLFKAMDAEKLRLELYDYMKKNPSKFQETVALTLSGDVRRYAEATDDQAGSLLLEVEGSPGLKKIYEDFRKEYQALPTAAEKNNLADSLVNRYWTNDAVKEYAGAMEDNKVYVGLIEAVAMKEMLNIRLGLHTLKPGMDGLEVGPDNLPIINIFRPKNKAHFELLVEKKPIAVEAKSTPIEKKSIPIEKKSIPIEKKSIPIEKKSTPIEKKSLPIEKKSLPIEKKSIPVDKKPNVTEVTSVDTKTEETT